MSDKSNQEPRIRANRYSLMTLEWPAAHADLADWLAGQCQRAPALMQEIGLVLMPALEIGPEAIEQAVKAMDHLEIDLIGLTGDPSHRATADRLGLPWLSANNLTQVTESVAATVPQEVPLTAEPAMIVQGPIRSGVQIYARDRDLVVLGQVSEGAEIMADGHVHVYGRLRGRVAAGVSGRSDACIFCQQFEPELVSVAGLYVGSEQIAADYHSATVRVGLDPTGNALTYSILS